MKTCCGLFYEKLNDYSVFVYSGSDPSRFYFLRLEGENPSAHAPDTSIGAGVNTWF